MHVPGECKNLKCDFIKALALLFNNIYWEETNTCDLTIFFYVTARRPQIDRHLFDGALL